MSKTEKKIVNPYEISEKKARSMAADLKRAGDGGVLHNVLEWTSELMRDDPDTSRKVVKILKRAAEDIDEETA